LPGGEDGFRDSPWTVGAGLRLGILRESFTVPGISITGMYRRVGGFTFGDRDLTMDDSFFDMSMGIWSLRAAVGKRITFLGLTLGAAYDHYSSDVEYALRDPAGMAPGPIRISVDDFENDRFALFGNVSWTLLILSLVAEIGWQSGADAVPAPLPANIDFDAEGSRFFGSLALRLSICRPSHPAHGADAPLERPCLHEARALPGRARLGAGAPQPARRGRGRAGRGDRGGGVPRGVRRASRGGRGASRRGGAGAGRHALRHPGAVQPLRKDAAV